VAIVGSGFWGSATALLLAQRGVDITVYDDGSDTGASRAAAGICKLSWYKQDTVRRMIDGVFTYGDFQSGFEWLTDQLAITHTPELFVNARAHTSRTHDDNYLGMPLALLSQISPLPYAVDSVTPDGHVHTEHTDERYDAIVVAAGWRTDRLLVASGLPPVTGVRPLVGQALLFHADREPDTDASCFTVMTRPYTHYTFRQWNGGWRGGDTVERKQDGKRIAALTTLAHQHFGTLRNLRVYGGIRPVCEKMYVSPLPSAPRIIAATGGHRVGFGLAGAVAQRIASQLGVAA
jgi:glycine/D-amino acid oxidase-like deaminating enzyme